VCLTAQYTILLGALYASADRVVISDFFVRGTLTAHEKRLLLRVILYTMVAVYLSWKK
jgi:hypothetical protein